MYVYRLYGRDVATCFDLGLSSSHSASSPSLVCEITDTPLAVELYGSTGDSDATSGEPICSRFEDAVEFCIDGDRVLVHKLDPRVSDLVVRVYFLGPVLSAWLEREGVLALHGSCVEIDDKAVAFLSASGGGKSNIALAALVAGSALMSDDIVAAESAAPPIVHPSFPQMRLWPEDIPPGWGPPDEFSLVHPKLTKRRLKIGSGGPGTFQPESRPLGCIYLPSRSQAARECRFEAVGPSDALMELVRCSFSPDFVEVTGLQPQRLSRLAGIVSEVPIRRLVYPEGREHLSTVWEAIVSDYRAIAG